MIIKQKIQNAINQHSVGKININILITMGAFTNKQSTQCMFNWINIQPNRYKNIHTNYIIDHHQIQLHDHADLNNYNKRLQINKQYISKDYKAGYMLKGEECCGCVYLRQSGTINKINRLYHNNNNNNIPHQNPNNNTPNNQNSPNFCICNKIIKGFQNLKQIYGPFQVTKQMIWLDQYKQIKIWFNKNPYINSFKSVKQNMMVLQIKEILKQLLCQCDYFMEEELTFNFGCFRNRGNNGDKSRVQVKEQSMKHKGYMNQDRSQSRKPIQNKNFQFYYPPAVKQRKSVKNQSHTSQFIRFAKPQQLSKTQKITFTHQISQSSIKLPTSNQTLKQCPSQSRLMPSNTKCSTPKINFKYQSQSFKQLVGTPSKISNFFRLDSEMTSPSQHSMMRFREGQNFIQGFNANLNDNSIKMTSKTTFVKENDHKNYNKTLQLSKNNTISLQKESSYFLNNKGKILPESSQHCQYMRINKTLPWTLNIKPKKQNLLLPEVKQNSSQVSIKKIQTKKRSNIYHNSFTSRQINESFKIYQKQRNSVQSQKLLASNIQIQYKVPQKTKKLIQKYLYNRKDSDRNPKSQKGNSQYTQNNKKIKNHMDSKINKKNKNNFIKFVRSSSINEEQQFAKTEQIERTSSNNNTNQRRQEEQIQYSQVNLQRATSLNGAFLQKYQRQKLKKQMQNIFNYCPQDQEENKIRKKVAQKRAIFADLKAQASKILQTQQKKNTQ